MSKLTLMQFEDKDAAEVYARRFGFKEYRIIPVWVRYGPRRNEPQKLKFELHKDGGVTV